MKWHSILAIVCMMFVITSCGSPERPSDMNELENVKKGQTNISFGHQKWKVLEVEDDRALLISENAVESMAFDDSETLSWADSEIRKYLNETYYENTFTSEEREKILETENENPDNPWFGTKGENVTKDRVFLLSIEECVRYFGDSGQLKNGNPDSQYCIGDEYDELRRITYKDEKIRWWLRSPGNNAKFRALVLA